MVNGVDAAKFDADLTAAGFKMNAFGPIYGRGVGNRLGIRDVHRLAAL